MLPPAAFRDRFMAAIVAATGQPAKPVDDHSFTARKADGTEVTINIDNAYARYLAEPPRIDAIIAQFSRLIALPEADAAGVEQLVVIVRPTDYIIRSLPPGADTRQVLPSRPMAGDLAFFLAVDSSEAIRTATADDLSRWHLNTDQAWTRGIANLKGRLGALQIVQIGGEQGPSGLSASSGLAPSSLAEPFLCGPAAPTGMAGQVVLVYSRDTFLFAVPSDTTQTRRFWVEAKRAAATGGSLSSTPLTCHDGKWVVAAPP